MLDCRRCINWVDKGFAQLEEQMKGGHSADSLFYGCRIFGVLESFQRSECPQYQEAGELFALCSSCGIAVPKVCISLGECVNCTDTDLYCVDHCRDEGEKKYCTHFQRLRHEGHTLIDGQKCFEVFPQPAADPAARKNLEAPVLAIFPEKEGVEEEPPDS